jgi:DNA-directed RNA polymerase subunit K/omega
VLVASQRARELTHGSKPRISNPGYSVAITALREIEQGKYTKLDYLKTLHKKDSK